MKSGRSETNLDLKDKKGHNRVGSLGLPRNCLGDLTSGHGFDNGCLCFESVFSDIKSVGAGGCTCGVRDK